MSEAHSRRVPLPEDSTRSIVCFIAWVYCSKVPDIGDDTNNLILAMEAWVLADKWCMPEWQDMLMDQMMEYARTYVIEPGMVAWVIDKLGTESLLYQFIMHQFAWDQIHSEDHYSASDGTAIRVARAGELEALLARTDFPHSEHQRSTMECARAISQARISRKDEQLYQPARNPCKYHVHEQGATCQKAKA